MSRSRFPFSLPIVTLLVLLAPPAFAQPRPGPAAGEARLDDILALALAQNPDVAEERARVAAAQASTARARRLPEAQLKYEQWGVPLRRPFALREGNALMVGIIQTLPAPGTREARGRQAAEEAIGATAAGQGRLRELRAQVRRAFADYYRADRELDLHRQHVELTTQLVELARASYRSGRRSQQDVLRLNLELARLHRDLAHVEQERISAQALLNALMNRPVDAPLGRPAELAPEVEWAAPNDGAPLERRRSELVAARANVRRSEAALDLARREGLWPSVTLAADYMYMPEMGLHGEAMSPHGYGAMVMLNLPWLSGARRDSVRAAEQLLIADRHAEASVRTTIAYQIRDARARHAAARSTFVSVDSDLLPQAKRNFEAAHASYAGGQTDAIALVDALRSYLDVRLDRIRSLVHLTNAAADLARAAGEKEPQP